MHSGNYSILLFQYGARRLYMYPGLWFFYCLLLALFLLSWVNSGLFCSHKSSCIYLELWVSYPRQQGSSEQDQRNIPLSSHFKNGKKFQNTKKLKTISNIYHVTENQFILGIRNILGTFRLRLDLFLCSFHSEHSIQLIKENHKPTFLHKKAYFLCH